MAITPAELIARLSGGSGNTDGDASLGGAISNTVAPQTINGLFDQVSGAESAAGDVNYRCIYLLNSNGTLTLEGAEVFVQSDTTSATTDVAIGLDPAGVNGTATTIANEAAAPAGVTFTASLGAGNALTIGDIPPGEHIAVWIRWTVNAGTSAINNDEFTLQLQGDTAA